MLKKINWPTAVVAIVGVVVLGSVALFGKHFGMSDEVYKELVVAVGSLDVLVLALMKSAVNK